MAIRQHQCIIFQDRVCMIAPAGVVVNPGAGSSKASSLCVRRTASIPRVAPRSLSNARASKNVELKPFVPSDSIRLKTF
jgi:hypothetical protein